MPLQSSLLTFSWQLSVAFTLNLQNHVSITIPDKSYRCIPLLHLWDLTLVPLLYHVHLSATRASHSGSLPTQTKAWRGAAQASGLAGGPSFAGVSSYPRTELDRPAKN